MSEQHAPPPEVLEQFGLGIDTKAKAAGIGNINTTWLVGDGPDIVLQNINTQVFTDPAALMANALMTTTALQGAEHAALRYLEAGTTGQPLAFDVFKQPWRAYEYVPGTVTVVPETTDDVRWVAQQFGRFDAALNHWADDTSWHIALPDFHNQAAREAQLTTATEADIAERGKLVQANIHHLHGLLRRLHELDAYDAFQNAPRRVAHHDAKAANVVRHLDGQGSSIIDLDTVMPGSILSDVGELVRTCSRTANEQQPDAAFDPARAVAAIEGFVDGWGSALEPTETAALPVAGAVLTLQNATRFLTDYLNGDIYFRVTDPEHNLRRFSAMANHGEAQLDALTHIAAQLANQLPN